MRTAFAEIAQMAAPARDRSQDAEREQDASRLGSDPNGWPKTPIARNGTVIVNGVELSQNVADQLRQLGISLAWYNPRELEAAVNACEYDGVLIDDPYGLNFLDKLEYTSHERAEDRGEIDIDPVRLHRLPSRDTLFGEAGDALFGEPQFRKRLKEDRDRRKETLASGALETAQPCG